jgi:hypothetical protein
MHLKSLLLFALLAASVVPARAWDETGHKVVAYIAWQEMTPEARAAVIDVLGYAPPRSSLISLSPPLRHPSRELLYFMRASIWPDIVRDRDNQERYERYHRGPWHYTNYFWEEGPDGAVERTDLQPEDLNIVERLSYLEEVAANDSYARAQRAVVIAWLEHLVGDIHQPLHASARVTPTEPEGDRGGNLFRLEERNNLHSYWDRLLSTAYPRGGSETEASHVARIGSRIMAEHPSAGFAAELSDRSYESWARRGLKIATSDAYDGLEREKAPSKEYAEKATAIAERSVALAGYRLAQLMNRIFS